MLRRWTMVGDEVIHSRETPAANRGTPPMIVVLPGGTTSRYTRPLLQALKGSVPASAVELPGIGSSSSVYIPKDLPRSERRRGRMVAHHGTMARA